MGIAENIRKVLESLPEGVKLVAVSKTKPVEYIEEAYATGQRVFGENRPQEMAAKYKELPKDIQWHMIGQLQEKNVKYIAPFVAMIHSVDSLKLLKKIDREAGKYGRVIPCLLEFHIAEEETKSGLLLEEAQEILSSEDFRELQHVRVCGVMGVATNTDDRDQVAGEFHRLHEIFDTLSGQFFAGDGSFREISMGMSGDYDLAVAQGSTMVRVGSTIFGQRYYADKKG